jgi:hypothetical protein
VNQPSKTYIGLFSTIGSSEIKNFGVVIDSSKGGFSHVGSIAVFYSCSFAKLLLYNFD